ncbi:hypothetical protein NQ314_020091 [Rhamnusium bicolor]|uniref:Uncharacterized protein n=1 Tax=Rhamnusium bicolor TaxID=1586634 RepID=A0AAV8WLS7_9CUCU|nr:hypothetical protein NQ314_020091 [Rhamnusium bicolor]
MDLQNSAITSLTSLLRIETYRAFEKPKSIDDGVFESPSFQSLLDSVRTPRTVVMSEPKENIMSLKDDGKNRDKQTYRSSEKYKMNLLEEAYFDTVFPNKLDRVASEDIEISFVENSSKALMAGAEICKILLYLYDLCDLKTYKDVVFTKKKSIVVAALTSLLCISMEAKRYALQKGLVQVIVKQLKEFHIRLSLESVECLRRVADKKRVCPILKEVNDLIGLLTNFMVNDEVVKTEAATLNLADIVHKLWVWFLIQNIYLVDVLRMLCIYTTGCNLGE